MLRVERKCGLTINNGWREEWQFNKLVLNYGRNQIFTCKFLLKLWYGHIQDFWKQTAWIFEGLKHLKVETNWMVKIYILQFKTQISVTVLLKTI
jgi:hypothetical protein